MLVNTPYAVINVRCVKTNFTYVAVRKYRATDERTINDLRSRFKSGVNVGHAEIIVQSIRKNGLEAHQFSIASVHATKKEALEHKVLLVKRYASKVAISLCMNMPVWSDIKMVRESPKI